MKRATPLPSHIRNHHLQWLLVLLLPLFSLFGSCAYNKNLQPAAATPTGEGGFELADRNHDGKLSRAEASDFLVDEVFNGMDLNHDGRVAKEEGTAGGDPQSAREFAKRDTNHDGVVTKEEALKYGRKHGFVLKTFREADKNHDGYLSKAEVQAYYASREGPPR
jgi:Ca2+-binding EF-hand superfamily protein